MTTFAGDNQCSYTVWMMVTVPRIAVAPSLDAAPFIYGIRCAADLRSGLTLSSPTETVRSFREGVADLALVPSSCVPSLPDAELATEYCIGSSGASGSALLAGGVPPAEARRIFFDPEAPAEARLAAYLCERHWRTTPEFIACPDPASADTGCAGDLSLLAGERALCAAGRYAVVCDLGAEWSRTTRQPFVFAVWVARKGADKARTEALQRALTFGLEHAYETVLDGGWADKPYDAYGHLTRQTDYIFDLQKHKALQKFWDSGIKVSPRANPG